MPVFESRVQLGSADSPDYHQWGVSDLMWLYVYVVGRALR